MTEQAYQGKSITSEGYNSGTVTGTCYPIKPPCFKSKCDNCPYRNKCENAEKKFINGMEYWDNKIRMD